MVWDKVVVARSTLFTRAMDGFGSNGNVTFDFDPVSLRWNWGLINNIWSRSKSKWSIFIYNLVFQLDQCLTIYSTSSFNIQYSKAALWKHFVFPRDFQEISNRFIASLSNNVPSIVSPSKEAHNDQPPPHFSAPKRIIFSRNYFLPSP